MGLEGRETTGMVDRVHFSRRLFTFLRQLRENNDRAWFEANRERYLADVRAPLQGFVLDFAPHLAKVSRHYVADPRPQSGSIFRIHRDTRFSRDKSPYKTMAAAQFRHERGKDVHAPGFYLHLEPGNVFAGAGLWHPDGETLVQVRTALISQPQKWKRIVGAPPFRRRVQLSGESLRRTPRGFPSDHELADDLRRKDFVTVAAFTEREACAPGFLRAFVRSCRLNADFMEFLTRAVGLPW